ncbi:MAG: hypothetical protein ACR2PB_12350 [Desulfocapsaceae bacterium]
MSNQKMRDVSRPDPNRSSEVASDRHKVTRRSLVKKMAVGTAALAGCSALPEKWITPFVEFGTLPAHATTSGALEAIIDELSQGIEETEAAEAQAEAAPEVQDNRGYDNQVSIQNKGAKISIDKIWRDKFVFPKLGPQYGPKLLIVWSDGRELYVPDSKKMIMYGSNDERKYQPGGPYSGNNPDIPTMEVYAALGTHPESVTVYY